MGVFHATALCKLRAGRCALADFWLVASVPRIGCCGFARTTTGACGRGGGVNGEGVRWRLVGKAVVETHMWCWTERCWMLLEFVGGGCSVGRVSTRRVECFRERCYNWGIEFWSAV